MPVYSKLPYLNGESGAGCQMLPYLNGESGAGCHIRHVNMGVLSIRALIIPSSFSDNKNEFCLHDENIVGKIRFAGKP